MQEKEIGKVIHYYDKSLVAVVKVNEPLSNGDKIKMAYGDREVVQNVESMEINHQKVSSVKEGQEVAIKVNEPMHDHALVYKIEE